MVPLRVFPLAAVPVLGNSTLLLGMSFRAKLFDQYLVRFGVSLACAMFLLFQEVPNLCLKRVLKNNWGQLFFHLKMIWVCCVSCSAIHTDGADSIYLFKVSQNFFLQGIKAEAHH